MMRKKKDDVVLLRYRKRKEKKTTLVGSKKTPVDTKPEVEYKKLVFVLCLFSLANAI